MTYFFGGECLPLRVGIFRQGRRDSIVIIGEFLEFKKRIPMDDPVAFYFPF